MGWHDWNEWVLLDNGKAIITCGRDSSHKQERETKECDNCNGSGKVWCSEETGTRFEPCSACNGDAFLGSPTHGIIACQSCMGTGGEEVPVYKNVSRDCMACISGRIIERY